MGRVREMRPPEYWTPCGAPCARRADVPPETRSVATAWAKIGQCGNWSRGTRARKWLAYKRKEGGMVTGPVGGPDGHGKCPRKRYSERHDKG